MPRYYRRRYTRVVRPKKKWASNITVWTSQTIATPYAVPLVINKPQDNAPTPTILKCGNFKITADLTFSISGTSVVGTTNSTCLAYILYVPEGWTASVEGYDNLITRHPEWIMATKVMGGDLTTVSSSSLGVDSLNMSTRLKRNLNSGDGVVLYLRTNFTTNITGISMTGNCRYWTCAN